MSRILFRNIGELLTLKLAAQKQGRHPHEEDLSIVKKAALLCEKGKIIWVGEEKKIPRDLLKKKPKEIDLQGKTVLPGFVECHTHSLFAGTRSDEFELRNQGVSYQQINARGGGIQSTMRETRKAPDAKLKSLLTERIERFVRQGVTTLEVKTGYALDLKNEIRGLKILNDKYKIEIVPTYLGAHSVPAEFQSAADYLQFCRTQVLPKVRKLTSRVDIFIEKGFFENPQALAYLKAAQELGFQVLVHADQLTLSGGADTAMQLQALSADHLLQVDDQTIHRLARSQVSCVLLPAADLYMKCAYPRARAMIDEGCRVALATDFNPGSSPTQDLSLVGLLARLEMKMTLPEVLVAYTVGASWALQKQHEVGSLEIGKQANFSVFEQKWTQLFYSVGDSSPESVYRWGRKI